MMLLPHARPPPPMMRDKLFKRFPKIAKYCEPISVYIGLRDVRFFSLRVEAIYVVLRVYF